MRDINEDSISHSGKLGMKWGVRMNPDGSYSNLKKAQKNYDKAYENHVSKNQWDKVLNTKLDAAYVTWVKKYSHLNGQIVTKSAAASMNRELNQAYYNAGYSIIKKTLGERPGGPVVYHSDEIEDFLMHYGKLGMKWGKRSSRPISSEHMTLRSTKKNSARKLSDAELKSAINRMQLERTYRELNPNKLKASQKAVISALAIGTTINGVIAFKNSAAGIAIVEGVKTALTKAVTK